VTDFELIEVLREDVLSGARALLGAVLARGERSARIVEVEAYRHDDPASHAYRKTRMKNMAMFGPAGCAYIYRSYGCHWMLNVVAGEVGDGSAVLIRAAMPEEGIPSMLASRSVRQNRQLLSGPGKLAQAFDIGPWDNALPLIGPDAAGLRIHPPARRSESILETPRIGIAIGKWHDVPWRFVDGAYREWASGPKRSTGP
jgi:DNA-3-methyladenine glycosylase